MLLSILPHLLWTRPDKLCACAQFLREQGLFETREELQQREDVLGRLAAVAVDWVRKVTRALALGDDFAEMSRATIQTFGSYRLGVHGPGAALLLGIGFIFRLRN